MNFSSKTPPPQIRYCIKRSDGQIVPLIPADDLALLLASSDVPRTLTPAQALDLGLQRVDVQPVDRVRDSRLVHNMHAQTPGSQPTSTTASPGIASSINIAHIDDTTELTPAIIHFLRNAIQNGSKKWCSKYLDTGDCAFAQPGCKYMHRIPPRELWSVLGFPHGRPWWAQKAAEQARNNHTRRVLAMVDRDSPNPQPAMTVDRGRPRVPTQVHSSIANASSAPTATHPTGAVPSNIQQRHQPISSPQSTDDINLIDFDIDEPRPEPEHEQTSSTSTSDTPRPAAKKSKVELASRTSTSTQPSSSSRRTFVPAGEDQARHIAESRARRRRSGGRHHGRGRKRNKSSTRH